ncbi:MAG: tetratricopeptide repeat protein [Rhodospirillales bacterium]|jgi:tetratricopeptide (TPR) repeat protein|nr:tetratricopeptide repeat protein [Rhodospirillales bacterium]
MNDKMQKDHVAAERDAASFFQQAGVAMKAGDPYGALTHVEKAVKCSPETAQYVAAMGTVLFQLNRFEQSEKALRRAQGLAPEDMEITGNLGIVLRHLGHHDEALSALRMVFSGGRATPKIFEELGQELTYQGLITAAEPVLQKLLKVQPKNEIVLTTLGRIKALLGDEAGADALWGRVPEQSADICTYRAQMQIMAGRMKEAVQTIEQALARNPGHATGLFLWAHAVDGEDDATLARQQVDQMIEGALNNATLSNDDWLNLNFAAGKLKDAMQDHAAAFEHYDAANKNVWERQSIPQSFYDDRAKGILEFLNADFFQTNRALIEREASGSDRVGEGLIFVFGMPRSGTTLVEQIIARDGSVLPGGELNHMEELANSLYEGGDTFPRDIDNLSLESVRQLAGAHHDRIRSVMGKRTHFTDKMPQNFLYMGLLRVLFPRAKFVHCVRGPIDTCLSCYFNYFTYGSIKYSYNLERLGQYYNLYRRMMDHWQTVIPGVVHDVRYEQLTGDPEASIRDLVDYCGLAWGEHFMSSPGHDHAVATATATASVAQVRKPIHKGAVGRWQAYEAQLAPLIKTLT